MFRCQPFHYQNLHRWRQSGHGGFDQDSVHSMDSIHQRRIKKATHWKLFKRSSDDFPFLTLHSNGWLKLRKRLELITAHMGINGSFIEKSFVVERPATGSKAICSRTSLPDLKPTECEGQIALRPLTGLPVWKRLIALERVPLRLWIFQRSFSIVIIEALESFTWIVKLVRSKTFLIN